MPEIPYPKVVPVRIEDALQDFSVLLSSMTTLDKSDVCPSAHTSSLTYLLSNPNTCSQECAIPSLSLENDVIFQEDPTVSHKEAAALSLAYPNFYCKSNIAQAPSEIVKNISSTFKTLIESKLRRYNAMQKENSKSKNALREKGSNDGAHHPTENSQLDARTHISTICTIFEVFSCKDKPNSFIPKEKVLPMILTTTIDLNVFGNPFTVCLQTPGTIAGKLARNGNGLLSNITINLDTMSLLEGLMQYAKLITKTAVSVHSTLADTSFAPNCMFAPEPFLVTSADHLESESSFHNKDKMEIDDIPEVKFSVQLLRRYYSH